MKNITLSQLLGAFSVLFFSVVLNAASPPMHGKQKPGATVHMENSSVDLPVGVSQLTPIAFWVPASTGLLEIELHDLDGVVVGNEIRRWQYVGSNIKPVVVLPLELVTTSARITFFVRAWENVDAGMTEAQIREQIPPIGRMLTLTARDHSKPQAQAVAEKVGNSRIKTLPDGSKRHMLPAQTSSK